jgi:HSP20 family molecular chaperone IbpA
MKTVHEEIEGRAYDLSRQRGWKSGRELEDWEQAEREVLCCPPSELLESEHEIVITATVCGVDVKTLQVDVLPNSITIEGTVGELQERNGENIHLLKIGGRRLLRQFALPARINPEEVTAVFDSPVIRIVARKAAATSSAILNRPEAVSRATA